MSVDVIIPIYNAFDDVKTCVESVICHTDLLNNCLWLVNDKSTDSRIIPLLNQFVSEHEQLNINVIDNDENMGFVRSVNIGLKRSHNDVILLNSDTIVTERWLEKLQKCAYCKNGVATVTPLSNNATLASVPEFLINNDLPSDTNIDNYAKAIEDCSMHLYPEIPTAHGFCMYIKREAINVVGVFDEVTFGKGYGEENDFCYKCLQVGYRHLLCDNTFIYHKGSRSFKEDKKILSDRHLKILKDKYPDFCMNTDLFLQKNPIFPIQANVRYGYEVHKRKNILMVVHVYQDVPVGNVGGASMHVHDLIRSLTPLYNFHVLYFSEADASYFLVSYFSDSTVTNYIGKCSKYTFPNLYNDVFKEYLITIIDLLDIDLIHVHHLLNMYLDVFKVAEQKNIPVIYSLHDFYMLCPSINLLDVDKQSCHFRTEKNCKRCTQTWYDCSSDFMTLWQQECHSCLKSAKKIIAPSESTKDICLSFYRDLSIDVIGHGYKPYKKNKIHSKKKNDKFNIAFIGGISTIKGLSYLKGLKEKVRGTDIVVHLFGMTKDTIVNVSSKNFVYHGQYERESLLNMLLENNIKIVCLFSIWAETFSYTLSESLLAGIPVITLDIGALAERVREADTGWIVPYRCSVDEVYKEIEKIRNNRIDYMSKVENIKKYLKNAKTTEDMANEYAEIYDGLMAKYPVHKNSDTHRMSKLMFYQNLKSPLLINENNMFSLRTEFLRLKNLVIKGDVPMSATISEVKKFRAIAKDSSLRNKIVFKLIWYRFIQKYIMIAVNGVYSGIKKIF